jgi:hypothetical protein
MTSGQRIALEVVLECCATFAGFIILVWTIFFIAENVL